MNSLKNIVPATCNTCGRKTYAEEVSECNFPQPSGKKCKGIFIRVVCKKLNTIKNMQNFNWETKASHSNNTETMNDYLENHLDGRFLILETDGSYAEIQCQNTNAIYAVHASGNGDFTHHTVRFEMLS